MTTSPDRNTKLSRNPDVIATDMDGDLVMMSIARGEYFGIGGAGPRVWEMLEKPTSLAALVAGLCAEFEVDEATCEADIRAFLAELQEHDLVMVA